MDFTRAFKYPFHNSAKVISIVLVLTILFTFCIALIASSHDWSSYLQLIGYHEALDSVNELDEPGSGAVLGMLGLMAVMVFEGFWLSGYSVEVIRAIMNNYDTMPGIEIGANLRKGFWLFLSGLWYAIVSLFLGVVLWLLVGIFSKLSFLLGSIASIGAIILAIAYIFLAGWAYFVGVARYAWDGDRSALYAIRHNMRIAREHRGPSMRLSAFMIALFLIYAIARWIVETAIGGFIGPDIVVAAVITFITYYAFNLFQHFSTQHLIAQYALEIGIGGQHEFDKDKVDYIQ
ncbi:MAG: DUF4013 domain-containing protein [Chloroflexi bacterium]|nr:DUF4013 domain-containing protein [Chloroflexota bacterium]